MSSTGMSRENTVSYIRGALDGLNACSANLKQNRMEMTKNETDPLFVHTWNYITNDFIERIDGLAKQITESMPKELGITYVNKDKKEEGTSS